MNTNDIISAQHRRDWKECYGVNYTFGEMEQGIEDARKYDWVGIFFDNAGVEITALTYDEDAPDESEIHFTYVGDLGIKINVTLNCEGRITATDGTKHISGTISESATRDVKRWVEARLGITFPKED